MSCTRFELGSEKLKEIDVGNCETGSGLEYK